jgi:hypothetical protein
MTSSERVLDEVSELLLLLPQPTQDLSVGVSRTLSLLE